MSEIVGTEPESFLSVQERKDSRDNWHAVGYSRRPYTQESLTQMLIDIQRWRDATGHQYRIMRTTREVEFEQ